MYVRTVLLVDDNPSFAEVAMSFLRRAGIGRLLQAESAKRALEVARNEQPDVVLLDLGMPGASGMEILPILRSMLPESIIIVLTLHDIDAYRRAALSNGADGFVPKASMSSDLLPTLEEAFAKGTSQ